MSRDEKGGGNSAAADEAMARYAAGDERAFATLYDALAPRLYGYLVRQTRAHDRAEDLLQQTLLQMHRARGSFIPGAAVTPWAFAIARRLLIDRARRSGREVLRRELDDEDPSRSDPVDPSPGADDLVAAHRLAARLTEELAKLPETQRAAFELVKQEGLSMAEAAEVLGTTATAVKLRAHRAYQALRAALGDTWTEEAP